MSSLFKIKFFNIKLINLGKSLLYTFNILIMNNSDNLLQKLENVRLNIQDDRIGMENESLKKSIRDNLYYLLGKDEYMANNRDLYMAVAYTVRDRLIQRWIQTSQTYINHNVKNVYYLSAEFLMGKQLENNLINLNIYEKIEKALKENAMPPLNELIKEEHEPGLGNGGLGRLAACFLDSLSTLQMPSMGYGIRYEFGIFEQEIKNGWQIEKPDFWLQDINPWEIERPEYKVQVNFGGHTEYYKDSEGKIRVKWIPSRTILGIPFDTPVAGYKNDTVNTLRLWSAKADKDFDFQIFNSGDYVRAVNEKVLSENISKVLYPNDNLPQGKQLRLEQQYFFVCCSLKDIIRNHLLNNPNLENLQEKAAIQLNDTHPSIAIAELMRILLDEHFMQWDQAWNITKNTFAYTNHTLLPEALEKWPVSLFETLLPRHLEIIYEINARFLAEIPARYKSNHKMLSELSIIEEGKEKKIRMANLACIGSFKVNGVAELHSELLKTRVMPEFNELYPNKFINKTNGVTLRRWMLLGNPELSKFISENIGNQWITEENKLKELEKFSDNIEFLKQWRRIKQNNKERLGVIIENLTGIKTNPNSIFDIQVKRIHEYKRQLLNALHIVALYNRIKDNPEEQFTPRTFIFGGKSAPGYYNAKLIIKLINSIADVVNNDPEVNNKLKVVYLPNFCVSLGEKIYPAADLSEQISTAGKEASGTGNMKFSLNGALTIGTLDGANVEIRQCVGEDNFFLFGLTEGQVYELRNRGYNAREYYEYNYELKRVVDLIYSGKFSNGDQGLFRPLMDSLMYNDEYMLFADYQLYSDAQKRVSSAYLNENLWTKMSLLNTARSGFFSSDRTIREYCSEIWGINQMIIDVDINKLDIESIKQSIKRLDEINNKI